MSVYFITTTGKKKKISSSKNLRCWQASPWYWYKAYALQRVVNLEEMRCPSWSQTYTRNLWHNYGIVQCWLWGWIGLRSSAFLVMKNWDLICFMHSGGYPAFFLITRWEIFTNPNRWGSYVLGPPMALFTIQSLYMPAMMIYWFWWYHCLSLQEYFCCCCSKLRTSQT